MNQSKSAEDNGFDKLTVNGKEAVQGITRISVQGYKSLYEECSIEIRPLTILAGANSSGKSSIMQPLLLMKQTLEATYDPGALLLNGPNVRFTLADQFLSEVCGKDKPICFAVKFEIDGYLVIKINFQKKTDKPIEIGEMYIQNGEVELTFSSELNREEILNLIPEPDEGNEFLFSFMENQNPNIDKIDCKISRERCFLELSCKYEEKYRRGDSFGTRYISLYDTGEDTTSLSYYIRELIHVPGLRDKPDRSYKVTAIDSTVFGKFEFPGRFEDYVASVVNHWQNTEDNKLRDLANALKTLGLTNKISAKQVNDVQIELLVNRLPGSNDLSDMVSIADVGMGVSQVLPVLVALLVAEPGQLVYLEQPEIHLHPRAQVGLAEVLANAANRGVRVVLETHSELLLLAIQSLVAEGKLLPDKVKLHWFTRREDGVTEVSTSELDEAGAFGDWPEDFGDVSLKLESRYLDAAEERLWKRSHGG